MDELIDIYDEENKNIISRKLKSEAHAKGLWHRSVHIWIYNSKAEVLIQLRQKDKPLYPDMWDISAAGHVSSGESPIDSALREIKEEVGISVKKSRLKLFRIIKHSAVYKDIKNNEFSYIYYLNYDKPISNDFIQKEELQEIKFISLEELKSSIKNRSK